MLIQITEKGEPTQENLSALVNFGCRLSLSNALGQVCISLEDPNTKPTFGLGGNPYLGVSLHEFPGLRGGEKDRIGNYLFWRTPQTVCFRHRENRTNGVPEYMIRFDGETLMPDALAVLQAYTRHAAIYLLIWGNRRGERLQMVL